MDVDPLQLNNGTQIIGWHLEFNRQLPDGILPPRRASIKDTYDGALQKMLGIVDIPEDVLPGMVVKSSDRDGVGNRAHLVPWVLFHWHRF